MLYKFQTYFFSGVASFFSVLEAGWLLFAQQDLDVGQFLAVLGSQEALSSFFSVAVVVLVVVVVVVDLAGVCGVWAKAIPAIRNNPDKRTIAFFIAIWFRFD